MVGSADSIRDARHSLELKLQSTDGLVYSLKFQEAEANISSIDGLLNNLIYLLDEKNPVHSNIRCNNVLKVNLLKQKIEAGLQKREAGKKEDGNIAFKCNWNDNNYRGVCSDSVYKYNQIWGGPWCMYSKCRQYMGFPIPPENCCYESRALIDCNFGAGWDHDLNGDPVYPRKIHSARRGKIALLTTIQKPENMNIVIPNAESRVLVGAFEIIKIKEDPGQETFLFGNPDTILDDMLKYNIHFWDHHLNPRNPESKLWSTGLFRYVSDIAVLGILQEYIEKKTKDNEDARRAKELLSVLHK